MKKIHESVQVIKELEDLGQEEEKIKTLPELKFWKKVFIFIKSFFKIVLTGQVTHPADSLDVKYTSLILNQSLHYNSIVF